MSEQDLEARAETYERLRKFNDGLLNGTSEIGRIISPQSIRQSSKYLEKVYNENMVAHGAAVKVDYF